MNNETNEEAYWRGYVLGQMTVIITLVQLFSPPLTDEHLRMQMASWMTAAIQAIGPEKFKRLYVEAQKKMMDEPAFRQRWNELARGVEF